jgi:hypothetical protein
VNLKTVKTGFGKVVVDGGERKRLAVFEEILNKKASQFNVRLKLSLKNFVCRQKFFCTFYFSIEKF